MLVGAVVSLIWAACPAHYGPTTGLTIQYPDGSAELPGGDRALINALLQPFVGDEMAEVRLTAYFPYGSRNMENADVPTLAEARIEGAKAAAVDLGVSSDLVGSAVIALGSVGDDEGRRYPADRLQVVELEVRVKTSCHPLADLARRMNPYR